MLKIDKPKSTKILAPQGTHVARIVSIIEVGSHQKEFDGKPKMVKQARISFELPNEVHVFKEDEPAKPMMITKTYTLALSEKANLRKLIEAVIGTTLIDEEAYAFDVHEILGKPVLITVKQKTNTKKETYAYVDTVSSLMKGVECPPQVNKSYSFTMSPFHEEKYLALPEFIRKSIEESPEYKNQLTAKQKDVIVEARRQANTAQDEELENYVAPDVIDPSSIPF